MPHPWDRDGKGMSYACDEGRTYVPTQGPPYCLTANCTDELGYWSAPPWSDSMFTL